MSDREKDVLNQLKNIIDPDLGKDIVSLGFIKDLIISDNGDVSFKMELTTPACPIKEQFKNDATEYVSKINWVKNIDVEMTAQPAKPGTKQVAPGLAGVKNIIGVSSCKGGVGKSTVCVNMAYALAKTGAKVGIFDADIYGPSLPVLVHVENPQVYQVDNLIEPIESDGVKLMSFGYVNQGNAEGETQSAGPAIMRGPMVSQVINQLLTGTSWGNLDYLLIDMPPGTGDIQLTLAQLIPMTAAVIITTPQKLAFVDVEKGIQMFDKLNVPTVAVVENMSYFICGKCDEKHRIFGQGALQKLIEQYGFKNSFEIPLNDQIAIDSDSGTPVVVKDASSPLAKPYFDIMSSTVREISRLQFGQISNPEVTYEEDRGVIVTYEDGKESILNAADLRRKCRCAHCVEEFSGKQLLNPEDVDNNIYPESISKLGNYAIAISWSDKHSSSIYPYNVLK